MSVRPDPGGARLVLVTGASAGIGRAACVAFARAGDRVLAVARRLDRLEALAAEPATAGAIRAYAADVASGPSMESLAARVLAEAGIPDVVVANAGIGLDASFADTSDEALHEVLEINVVGVFRTLRPFVPRMVERGSGRLVVVSSIVGKRGVPNYSAYAASKFALHGMAGALRAELHGSGVTIGIVCPSSTDTEFRESIRRAGPPQNRQRARRHPVDRVAAAIVRMSRSRARETVLSAEGRLMVVLDAVAPSLVDRILARMLKPR